MIVRRTLAVGVGAALCAGWGQGAAAASYPAKPINFLIPFSPGGGFDLYVRTVIPEMRAHLPGHRIILPQNDVGAAGMKVANELFRDRPDGYNIGILNIPGLLVLGVLGMMPFDLQRLTWIGNLGRDHYGLAVAYDSPLQSLDELQTLGRKRSLLFTCTGPGSTGHCATLIATHLLGLPARLIAGYTGTTDYLVGVVRGDGDAAICSLPAMTSLVRARQLRILASFEAHTTIKDAVDATSLGCPDLTRIVQLRPVAAPPALPPQIGKILSNAMAAGALAPSVEAWAKRIGANLDPMTGPETTSAIADQIAFIDGWRAVLTGTK